MYFKKGKLYRKTFSDFSVIFICVKEKENDVVKGLIIWSDYETNFYLRDTHVGKEEYFFDTGTITCLDP